MGRVSEWAVRRPVYALFTWLGIMAVVVVLGLSLGGNYNDNFQLPDTESTTAQNLLQDLSGSAGTGAGLDGQVVWKAESGKATEGGGRRQDGGAAHQDLDHAWCRVRADAVRRPARYGVPARRRPTRATTRADQNDQQSDQSEAAQGAQAHFGQSGVSPDGTVAYATVTFKGKTFDDLDTDQVTNVLNLIKAQDGENGLQVGANNVFGFVGGSPPSSEGIGVTVALVILLFAFGSILGAFLPIVSAVLSVALTTGFALPLVARVFDVATFAPVLASMIGLGVGIDYSLFVINRYREAIIHGREPRAAALESVRTSGRAVQFAAATVIIALLGLFVMRISFFNGIAIALRSPSSW